MYVGYIIITNFVYFFQFMLLIWSCQVWSTMRTSISHIAQCLHCIHYACSCV